MCSQQVWTPAKHRGLSIGIKGNAVLSSHMTLALKNDQHMSGRFNRRPETAHPTLIISKHRKRVLLRAMTPNCLHSLRHLLPAHLSWVPRAWGGTGGGSLGVCKELFPRNVLISHYLTMSPVYQCVWHVPWEQVVRLAFFWTMSGERFHFIIWITNHICRDSLIGLQENICPISLQGLLQDLLQISIGRDEWWTFWRLSLWMVIFFPCHWKK